MAGRAWIRALVLVRPSPKPAHQDSSFRRLIGEVSQSLRSQVKLATCLLGGPADTHEPSPEHRQAPDQGRKRQ